MLWTVAAGDPDADEELKLERAWLASCTRCFIDQDLRPKIEPKPEKHRLATYWWLVALDGLLREKTSQGLEAFSSPGTLEAVKRLLGKDATEQFLAEWHLQDSIPFASNV